MKFHLFVAFPTATSQDCFVQVVTGSGCAARPTGHCPNLCLTAAALVVVTRSQDTTLVETTTISDDYLSNTPLGTSSPPPSSSSPPPFSTLLLRSVGDIEGSWLNHHYSSSTPPTSSTLPPPNMTSPHLSINSIRDTFPSTASTPTPLDGTSPIPPQSTTSSPIQVSTKSTPEAHQTTVYSFTGESADNEYIQRYLSVAELITRTSVLQTCQRFHIGLNDRVEDVILTDDVQELLQSDSRKSFIQWIDKSSHESGKNMADSPGETDNSVGNGEGSAANPSSYGTSTEASTTNQGGDETSTQAKEGYSGASTVSYLYTLGSSYETSTEAGQTGLPEINFEELSDKERARGLKSQGQADWNNFVSRRRRAANASKFGNSDHN